jgi:UDP-3-O-[3-hydroxymyristoyl] glucosamine N-acyltransferase
MTTLRDIADLLKVSAPARAEDVEITGLATLRDAEPGDLSFLGNDRFLDEFAATKAAAVVVQKRVKLPVGENGKLDGPIALIVDDADLAMANVAALFAPPIPRPPIGVDPSARVAPGAELGERVAIGANVQIGAGARIGAGSVLHANVFIGDATVLGRDCELFPNVVVRERCTLGDRVIVHACSAIGSDGFGYRWDGQRHAKIPQIGTVVIEDDVEIGSCSCVDRAKFGVTRVGRGTKIDNLVQIAHNSTLGPHCIFAGQSGTAGSVTLGAGVVLGGGSRVKDHARMGDRSMLAACSGVLADVQPGQIVSGVPAIPHRQHLRELAALRDLPGLQKEVRKLQEELAALKRQIEAANAGNPTK